MKRNNLVAYLLIGIGLFFLLRELKLPILTDFYSWPTLLILIGAAFLIQSFSSKEYKYLFPGMLLLGLGIHFHGVTHYSFWIDHWGMFTLVVSIAFLTKAWKTKKGYLPGLILLGISIIALFVDNQPGWFGWVHQIVTWMERFWPVLLIVFGGYLLMKRK